MPFIPWVESTDRVAPLPGWSIECLPLKPSWTVTFAPCKTLSYCLTRNELHPYKNSPGSAILGICPVPVGMIAMVKLHIVELVCGLSFVFYSLSVLHFLRPRQTHSLFLHGVVLEIHISLTLRASRSAIGMHWILKQFSHIFLWDIFFPSNLLPISI